MKILGLHRDPETLLNVVEVNVKEVVQIGDFNLAITGSGKSWHGYCADSGIICCVKENSKQAVIQYVKNNLAKCAPLAELRFNFVHNNVKNTYITAIL
jgi:hypothetical protein